MNACPLFRKSLLLFQGIYLIPLIVLEAYSLAFVSSEFTFQFFALGLALVLFGMTAVYTLYTLGRLSPEALPAPEPKISQSDAPEFKDNRLQELESELSHKETHLLQILEEKERNQKQMEAVMKEFNEFKKVFHAQIEDERNAFMSCQASLAENHQVLERKQAQILQLDGKVEDLMFEIQTLLQISEEGNFSAPHKTPLSIPVSMDNYEEVTEQALWRFMTSIQKKMSHRKENAKMRSFSALNLRDLFECLKNEAHVIEDSLILVYSLKETRVLFVHGGMKDKLGWGQEKLIQSFNEIVDKEYSNFEEAMNSLDGKESHRRRQVDVNISLISKQDDQILLSGHAARIQLDSLDHLVLGVFVPVISSVTV